MYPDCEFPSPGTYSDGINKLFLEMDRSELLNVTFVMKKEEAGLNSWQDWCYSPFSPQAKSTAGRRLVFGAIRLQDLSEKFH